MKLEMTQIIVAITGAANGMGRLYAQRAVKDGAKAVVLIDRDGKGLEEAKAELIAMGGTTGIHTFEVDLANDRARSRLVSHLGTDSLMPDVLINNAGIVRGNDYFWLGDPERDIRPTMEVNAIAPMLLTRALLPHMINSGRPSRIVNIASAAATLGNPRMAAYAASKAAMFNWSESLRIELAQAQHTHVKVTTVAPTYISTGMFEGARGPLLAPVMHPGMVVAKVWRGMLEERPLLLIPRAVLLSRFFRGILSTRAFDVVVGKWFQVYRGMDEFTGRPESR